VLGTLESEGGSCTYERLFVAAEEYHCDVLAAAVMSLQRAKKISYEGTMLLMPGHKDVIITMGDAGPSPAAAKAAQEKAEAAAREKAAAAEQARREAAAAAEAEAEAARKAKAKAAAEAEAQAQAEAQARAAAEAKAAEEARARAVREAKAEAEAAEKARADAAAAAAAATPDTVVARYTCRMKSQIRAGFAMDSDKAGVLGKGEVIDAFEEQANDAGTTRVRFSKGWVSMKTGKGDLVLEPVGGVPAAAATPAPAAPASDPVLDRVAELKEAGMQHFANREFAESIAALEEAARLDPADEEITEALAFARAAEMKYKQDQSAKLQERAMEYFTEREFDAAVDALQKALVYTPGDAEILEALEYAKSQTAVE
jgi:hypothetical protein